MSQEGNTLTFRLTNKDVGRIVTAIRSFGKTCFNQEDKNLYVFLDQNFSDVLQEIKKDEKVKVYIVVKK